jgi:hypothetical protein
MVNITMRKFHFVRFFFVFFCLLASLTQSNTNANGRTFVIPSFAASGPFDSTAVAPNGRTVYIIEADYFEIAQFHVQRDGRLVKLNPFKAQADAHPSDLVFDQAGVTPMFHAPTVTSSNTESLVTAHWWN